MSQSQNFNHAPVVSLINDRPATTSLQIAECFDKRHDHVLRDIQSLIDQCPTEFNAPNFGAVEYKDAKGEMRPMYQVFFDGFILLVMGYTGPKALKMKLAYIEAFNKMRAKLEAKHPLPNGWRLRKGAKPAIKEEHCTHGEAAPIEKAVDAWCAEKGLRRLDALAAIRIQFGLRIFDRPPRHLHEAILAWINERRGIVARNEVQAQLPVQAILPEIPEGGRCPLKPRTLEELLKDAKSVETSLARLVLHISLEFGMPFFLAKQNCKGEHLEDMARAIDFNLQGAHAAACTALNQLRSAKYLCHAVRD